MMTVSKSAAMRPLASRLLVVFKELDSILFYPVQYEGEESERNVFYTGAAPNQQAIPAVGYLVKQAGFELGTPNELTSARNNRL